MKYVIIPIFSFKNSTIFGIASVKFYV